MAVVDDDIWLGLFVGDDPQTSDAMTDDFAEEYWALQVAVAEKSKAKERVGNPL